MADLSESWKAISSTMGETRAELGDERREEEDPPAGLCGCIRFTVKKAKRKQEIGRNKIEEGRVRFRMSSLSSAIFPSVHVKYPK